MMVILDRPGSFPESLFLLVEDIKYFIEINEEDGAIMGFYAESSASSKGSFSPKSIGKAKRADRAVEGETEEKGDDAGEGDSNFESPFGWRKLVSVDSG